MFGSVAPGEVVKISSYHSGKEKFLIIINRINTVVIDMTNMHVNCYFQVGFRSICHSSEKSEQYVLLKLQDSKYVYIGENIWEFEEESKFVDFRISHESLLSYIIFERVVVYPDEKLILPIRI